MSANTTAKSILETTADSGIAALHRGGRAAIYGRVAQHERMSPFRAGACRAKARRSTESLMRALKGTPWYSSELDHARSHCDGHHLHGSRVFITCPSEFRSNILHYNRNLETHTVLFRIQPKAELMMDVLLHYREQMRNILHE